MDQQLSLFEEHHPSNGKYSFFLALFPDPNTAEQLIELGTKIRRENGIHSRLRPLTHLHVSLHFFGYGSDVSAALTAVLDPTCKAVASQTPSFNIELDHVMSFRGRPGNNPLVLMGHDQKNTALKKLHQSLEVQLVKSRLASRPNNKFVPHITLLYDKQILAPTAIDPVAWRVEEMVLVRSEVGATKYERPGRWTLGS